MAVTEPALEAAATATAADPARVNTCFRARPQLKRDFPERLVLSSIKNNNFHDFTKMTSL
jgi:hypothetical protein